MSSIAYFEIPADDTQRAKRFYSQLFGWKIEDLQGSDYLGVDTYGLGGGMLKRRHPELQITNYIGVPSVDEYLARAEKLGGKILLPKEAIPGRGYFAIIKDTENNAIGLWEWNMAAK
jgi:predicted enzyme related to lactoylglutathione lyase